MTGFAVGVLTGLLLLLAPALGGDISSAVLLPTTNVAVGLIVHILVSAGLGVSISMVAPESQQQAATCVNGVIIGLLWWIAGPLTVGALISGTRIGWSAANAGQVFEPLVASILFGGVAGLFYFWASRLVSDGAQSSSEKTAQPDLTKVLVLGGGFAGVATAEGLERLFPGSKGVSITLVSPSNYLLFTPMLAEVAGSSLEAQHVAAPIRASCPRTSFIRGTVDHIDLATQSVSVHSPVDRTLRYDHLVLAMGSVPNYRDLPGMEEHSFTLKSLNDATRLRNHVLGLLERADTEPNPIERKKMLTFVVAGGGFAGTETIAELFDLVHSTHRYFPNIVHSELRFILVHSRDRILPEIGPELADYALQKLRRRGIEFRLETRVGGATGDAMLLANNESIPTRTLVWTAGNQTNPALATLPCEHGRGGALVVEPTLQVSGHENVWAAGDNAQIPDPDTDGGYYPPTAQHALREGKAIAKNISAVLGGSSAKPFRFKTLGILVALGHRTAVAEIKGLRFSGLIAWLLWRGIYLSKLPGLEKKVRVFLDWTLDLLFPRDIVVTSETLPAFPAATPSAEAVSSPTNQKAIHDVGS